MHYKHVIAPGVTVEDLQQNQAVEKQVEVVEGRIQAWHFDVANELVNREDKQGYAALAIILNVPEAIWQFRHGKSTENHSSKSAFVEEMRLALSKHPNAGSQWTDKDLRHLYKVLRCSGYHSGF